MTTDSDIAISIENVSKRYTIGHQKAAGDGFRHALEGALRSPMAWLRSQREKKLEQVDFWALKDVSVQIKQGDVVGILGKNGAGKSTLLKLLSRITVPTKGRIRINGRIASLLEVGTGFHAELTGRENVFLNGAILGMGRAEIVRKFDEIVAFSEIEEFLDTPVKRYSSGMYVRLAFSVAAHLDPEMLIVDEVLAVGDTSFQKKCLAKIASYAQNGRTVLFVSHNLDAVRTLCKRGIWLKSGQLYRDGRADAIVEDYFNDVAMEKCQSLNNEEYGLSIQRVLLKNDEGQECGRFLPGDNITVEVQYHASKRVKKPIFALGIFGANGSCFTSNMLLDGYSPEYLEGDGVLTCTFKSIPLLPQNYSVKLSVRAETVTDTIVAYQEVAYFSVAADLADYGYRGAYDAHARYSTAVVVPYEWRLPDGSTYSVSLNRQAAALSASWER
jgi:lipopolysaccharide transport system ATP-binding protein